MLVVIVANLYNLAMVVVLVARAEGHETMERRAGLFTVACGVPLVLASTAP